MLLVKHGVDDEDTDGFDVAASRNLHHVGSYNVVDTEIFARVCVCIYSGQVFH